MAGCLFLYFNVRVGGDMIELKEIRLISEMSSL